MWEYTQYEDEDGRCVRCTVRRDGHWYRGDLYLPFRLQNATLLPLIDAKDASLHVGHIAGASATIIRERLAEIASELLADTVIWQRRDTELRMTDADADLSAIAADAPWLLEPERWEPVYDERGNR